MCVIAILAILAAITIPTLAAARASAAKARTRVQFSQWTLACAQFRQEYGFNPALGTANRLASAEDSQAFIRVLTGRNADGSEVEDPADLGGNVRRIRFLSLADSDLREGRLIDGFGNREFGVLRDIDADGIIRPGMEGGIVAIDSLEGGAVLLPASRVPAPGIRAGVAFYSAGQGRSAEDFVTSWP